MSEKKNLGYVFCKFRATTPTEEVVILWKIKEVRQKSHQFATPKYQICFQAEGLDWTDATGYRVKKVI